MLLTPNDVQEHKQIYEMSCVPMSVEFLLKLLRKLPPCEHPYQLALGQGAAGKYSDYNGCHINGVTFAHRFSEPRGLSFPLEDLFAAMRYEIASNRYFSISLAEGQNFHMYVVYGYDPSNDEFLAISKGHSGNTWRTYDVKSRVKSMQGTDILTYTEDAL